MDDDAQCSLASNKTLGLTIILETTNHAKCMRAIQPKISKQNDSQNYQIWGPPNLKFSSRKPASKHTTNFLH